MSRVSPTVAQFEFAGRIRHLRERKALTAAAVATHLGFSRNFYSAVENSRTLLADDRLKPLIRMLDLGRTEALDLTELLAVAKRPAWWHRYSSGKASEFDRLLGLEYGASKILSYESLVFHGLLQTEEYARSVVEASPETSPVSVDQAVARRLQRQTELLGEADPPKMVFLCSEAVLMQQFGGRKVLKAQLVHVLDLAERLESRLDFRVQRFDATPLGLTTASTLVLLDFENDFIPEIAYREAGIPIGIDTDFEVVGRLHAHMEQAERSTMNHMDSLALIRQRVREI